MEGCVLAHEEGWKGRGCLHHPGRSCFPPTSVACRHLRASSSLTQTTDEGSKENMKHQRRVSESCWHLGPVPDPSGTPSLPLPSC